MVLPWLCNVGKWRRPARRSELLFTECLEHLHTLLVLLQMPGEEWPQEAKLIQELAALLRDLIIAVDTACSQRLAAVNGEGSVTPLKASKAICSTLIRGGGAGCGGQGDASQVWEMCAPFQYPELTAVGFPVNGDTGAFSLPALTTNAAADGEGGEGEEAGDFAAAARPGVLRLRHRLRPRRPRLRLALPREDDRAHGVADVVSGGAALPQGHAAQDPQPVATPQLSAQEMLHPRPPLQLQHLQGRRRATSAPPARELDRQRRAMAWKSDDWSCGDALEGTILCTSADDVRGTGTRSIAGSMRCSAPGLPASRDHSMRSIPLAADRAATSPMRACATATEDFADDFYKEDFRTQQARARELHKLRKVLHAMSDNSHCLIPPRRGEQRQGGTASRRANSASRGATFRELLCVCDSEDLSLMPSNCIIHEVMQKRPDEANVPTTHPQMEESNGGEALVQGVVPPWMQVPHARPQPLGIPQPMLNAGIDDDEEENCEHYVCQRQKNGMLRWQPEARDGFDVPADAQRSLGMWPPANKAVSGLPQKLQAQ